MLNIKNKGVTKTVMRYNGRTKENKINWNADYDGEVANISLEIEDDGVKDKYTSQLTNDELVALLNPPQENQLSLDERLLNDFGNDTPQMVLQIETPQPIFMKKPKRVALKKPPLEKVEPKILFPFFKRESEQKKYKRGLTGSLGTSAVRRDGRAKPVPRFSKRDVKKRPSNRRSTSRRSISRRSTSRRNSSRRNKKRSLYVRM